MSGFPLSIMLPEGTRDVLPAEWTQREHLRRTLSAHFAANGYQGVDVPTLEYQSALHPQDAKAFKLTDRNGAVLSLRSEFTTAITQLARRRFAQGPFPLRLQYAGRLWLRSQASELGRLREFTQVGVELLGIRSPQADAELLHLALSALAAVGVQAQLEVGHPGFVDGLLEDSGVTGEARAQLHRAVDRKSGPDLHAVITRFGLGTELGRLLSQVLDLYGGPEVLEQAGALPLGPNAAAALDDLRAIYSLYYSYYRHAPNAYGHGAGQHAELLFDLSMSRRYDYYTGFTFRAYVAGHAQQVLGGGRYGGVSESRVGENMAGAGFAIGLERLSQVATPQPQRREEVLALDEAGARHACNLGLIALRAWTDDPAALHQYATQRGIARVARGQQLLDLQTLLSTPTTLSTPTGLTPLEQP